MLTKRQKEILDFITKYKEEHDYAPTLEEIQENFGLSSVATVHEHVENLKEKGHLRKLDNRPRSIELNDKGEQRTDLATVPLLGTIVAGKPIEPIEDSEQLSVPKSMVSEQDDYYALRVNGDSMIEEGICNGDKILVKDQQHADKGDTVIALLRNGEATLKKYHPQPKKERIKLQPANEDLDSIYTKDCKIQGKVISVIRNF